MSLNSFLTQSGLRFIPYTGPPEPKPKSRRNPLKTTPSNQHEYLVHNKNPSTGPAVSLHRAGDVDVETADKDICKLEDYSSCRDIGCAGGLLPADEQGVEVEHFVSSCFSKEVLREGSSDLSSFGDSSQEDVVVTVGSEPELDATTAKENLVTQAHDCTPVPVMATCNYRGTDGTDDAISLELLEVPESQASRLPNRNLTSTSPTPSTRSSMMDIGQPTQGASGDTLPESITHQSQGSVHEMAEEQAAQYSDYDTERCYSDESSDGSSGRRLGSNKRLKSAHRSSKQRRKRDRY
ncbi:hypothetical protein PtrSN002B_011762, partial [Pyrenophora tritici-repentis]